MATEKPRITVTLSEEIMEQVDNYRFEHRIKTQSRALNELISLGIAKLNADFAGGEEPVTEDGLTEEESEFMSIFDDLSPSNQRLLIGIGALILQEQQTSPD